MNYSKFDPKLLYNIPKGYNCTILNKAVAKIDIDLVKNILTNNFIFKALIQRYVNKTDFYLLKFGSKVLVVF